MIRIAFWFLGVLLIAAGAAWLADHPGAVTLDFQGYEVRTSFAALILMGVLGAAVAGFLVWLVGWIKRDMPFFGSGSMVKRQGRGLRLLNQALVALAGGDHKLARRLVEQAEVLLPPQPMVHLIAAESAARAGDHAEAGKRYRALEATEDGRLIGLRGLLGEARRQGHESEALTLARQAFVENRKSPWVLKTLFSLEVAAGNWQAAEEALGKVAREGLMEAATIKRHQGALAYAEAAEAALASDRARARKLLKKALAARAGFIPALIALAKIEQAEGNRKRAEKIITDAWAETPHPALVPVYKSLDAAESMADWLIRVRRLTNRRPEHPDSLLVLTDALMDTRDYDTAAPILAKLTHEAPSRAAWQYRLALAHVRGENPDPIEAALAQAPAGAAWHCSDCGHAHAGWAPLCPACDGFDTLDWQAEGETPVERPRFDSKGTIQLLTDQG